MHMKFSRTLKKDSFMMTMVKKESRMADLLEEVDSAVCLRCLEEEAKNLQVLEKVNLN